MANEGYIIIKSKTDGRVNEKVSYKKFYGPLDKGSAKPSFCYPRAKSALKEEIESMGRALERGYIDKEREMSVRAELKTKENKLRDLNSQEAEATKMFKENEDAWVKRHSDLAEDIRSTMPSATDVAKKRANPYRILQNEKEKGLDEKKREYQVLSHLMGVESNTGFLQKD
jgi:hypothetical protein